MHEASVKVRFSELDPYRHVNHAAYLTYLEVGRVEALEAVGHSLDALQVEGVAIVVVELSARFLRPAFTGDLLTVRSGIAEIGRASSRWYQEIVRGDERIVEAEVKGAIVDLEGRPRRMPESLRRALEALRTP